DTLAGQIDGFMQFSENPAQTIGNSVNYFLSDPLRNNPVADVAGYYKDMAIASYSHDWDTVSYKLGVGVVNLTEFYVGGKIASKMPEIKASAANVSNNIARKLYDTKTSALGKIGNYADDFRTPSPALACGIDAPAIKSEITSNAGGVRAGAEKSIYYSSKGAGKASGGGTSNGSSALNSTKISYGELDKLGRPTGAKAIITNDMIGTGSAASSSITPPGFAGGGKGGAGHARGHLLGKQLGGSGKDPRNLVTLYQNPVNSPVMRDFETSVRRVVEKGQTVNYSATPVYKGEELIPSAVTIKAVGNDGFQLDVTILNRK
ncbi:MAG: DNA/RNA non-specific endonuclease, partial [Oscillospiraceae bacterium]|nr:DNA/RNA non-specific endonuclease [Oscillospiraceae bacterium]